MNIKLKLASMALLCLMLNACDTYTAAPYGISMDTDVALKRIPTTKVTVGTFTAAPDISMLCRLVGPINLPGDVLPQDYVSKALSDELELAGFSNGPAPGVTLTGHIDQMSFNSMIGDAYWTLGLTVVSSNGAKLSVTDQYDFHASFVGDAACHNVADAFEPATQALIAKLISDRGFPALLKD